MITGWGSRAAFDCNSAAELSSVAPVLQCVAVRCSALQCVVVHCSVLQCVAVCCSVLQSICVCVCEWQARGTVDSSSAADLSSVAPVLRLCCSVLQCAAVCYSVLQCVAMCCSMLQRVAVCCSVCVCVHVSVGLEERLIQILQRT